MKKTIFVLLVLLICAIQTSTAYEYFTIYFSDDTKSEAFYSTDVDSICYSKLSLDGIEYPDWQVQEIYTCDSVYRYPLAQIDSLSFKDVDENKVAEDIVNVCKVISPIYGQCNSTEDISTYLSYIKSQKEIDDAWTDNQTLFVKIKDFGTVTYLYPTQDKHIDNLSLSNTRVTSRTETNEIPAHDRIDAKKVCIVNQQFKDEGRENKRYVSTEVEKYCNQMGIYPKIENRPLPSFFENDIYGYDVVILMTHGHYDERSGLHWLTTSDELCVTDNHGVIGVDSIAKVLISRGYYKKYSTKDISFSCIPEIRNGDSCQVYYTQISNQFISNQKKIQFRNKGNVIVFNTACQSLKGNPETSYNLANAFRTKGARAYLGYDEVNSIGAGASLLFLLRLLNGQSTEQAYETLPNECKTQKIEFPEKSGKYVEPHLIHAHNTNFGIVNPQTLSAETYDNEGERIKIKGQIKILNPNGEEAQNNIYGFLYSESPNMDDCKPLEGIQDFDVQTHILTFEYIFRDKELKSGTTYYYCACMNDGYSDCFGEIKSFTTKGDAEAYTVFEGDTLTFYYDSKKEERLGNKYEIAEKYDEGDLPQWRNYDVKVASFDSSFLNYYPSNTAKWFWGLANLEKINNLKNLNTAGVTDMREMFYYCTSLTNLDLSSFDTTNVTDMSGMFSVCSLLSSLDVSNFNTDNVTNMSDMFHNCSGLTSLDVSNFNTANVTDMSGMFRGCSLLSSLDVSNFNTDNVTNMSSMFDSCSGLISLDLSNFNTSNVTDMSGMFSGCSLLSSLDVSNFSLAKSEYVLSFYGLSSLEILKMKNFDCANITYIGGWFSGLSSLKTIILSGINTTNIKNMRRLFNGCSSLTSLDLSSFDTSSVTDMSEMFSGCSLLSSLDLSSFDTSSVTDMSEMFSGCSLLSSLDLSSFNTSNVTDMSGMFRGCSLLSSLDLSSFNTSNVTVMSGMFSSCSLLSSLDLSSFNTSNVTVMSAMFSGCSLISSLDVSNFNTDNVTDMGSMFYSCSGLISLDLSNFNTSNVTDMSSMFCGCSSLKTIYAGDWNSYLPLNADSDNMFGGCFELVGGKGSKIQQEWKDWNYDGTALFWWERTDARFAHIDGGPENRGFFTAK